MGKTKEMAKKKRNDAWRHGMKKKMRGGGMAKDGAEENDARWNG